MGMCIFPKSFLGPCLVMKTINKLVSFLIFLTILLWTTAAFAWNGKVVSVTDGDTIKVLHDGEQVKVRLYGIMNVRP